MNCHDCPNALLGLDACALLVADRELIDCSLPRNGAREDCPLPPRDDEADAELALFHAKLIRDFPECKTARLHRAARAAARPGRAIETIRIGLRREFPLGATPEDLENWINGPATGEEE